VEKYNVPFQQVVSIFVAFVMWEELLTGVEAALLSVGTVVWLAGARGFVTQDYCRQVIARGLSRRLGSARRIV